jgi:uncharacterized protein YpuA (DUF1002 family)
MKLTSAEANKLLRKLNDEHEALTMKENAARTFVAATIENLEDARPNYDYADIQKQLDEMEKKIRTIKHAINVFNVTQVLPDFNMTIDQALVYIPQLTMRKRKLSMMRAASEKVRNEITRGSNIIEYTYANYSIADADADYNKTADELAKLQNNLDLINNTVKFDVDL